MQAPTGSTEKVRLKLDRTTGMWVVTGRGQAMRFKLYEAAEAEAMRRAGFQKKVTRTSFPRSR